MFANSGAWASYGFRDADAANEQPNKHKHPFLELGFDDPSQKHKKCASGNHQLLPSKKVEKQKERVLDATMKRMITQRIHLQKELLRGLDQKYINFVFNNQHLVDAKYQELQECVDGLSKGDQDDGSLVSYSWLPMDNSKASMASEGKKKIRPKSAVTVTFPQHQTRRNSAPFQGAIQSTGPIESNGRVQSAPVSRRKSLDKVRRRTLSPKVKNVAEDSQELNELRRSTRSGCEHCPVECRQVSNSAWMPVSSTGLHAVSGPNHYQYYHYDRYIKHQRPRSAIYQRREFLERKGRTRPITPRFTNIVSSCTVYEKERRSKSPDTRSVRSTSSQEKPTTKDAWTEDTKSSVDLVQDSMENVHISELNFQDEIEHATEEDDQPSDTEIYDDEQYNSDVRLHAEATYNEATSNESLIKTDLETETKLDFLPQAPTPTPLSSRSPSPQTEPQATEEVLTPYPEKLTDMLTGRVLHGEDVLQPTPALSPSINTEEDFAGIRVEIITPPPLPIKRIPEPNVQTVDVVEPRQELDIYDDDYEQEIELVEKQDEDIQEPKEEIIVSNENDKIELDQDDFTDDIVHESEPVSILKTPSEIKPRDKVPQHVSFQINEDIEDKIEEIDETKQDLPDPTIKDTVIVEDKESEEPIFDENDTVASPPEEVAKPVEEVQKAEPIISKPPTVFQPPPFPPTQAMIVKTPSEPPPPVINKLFYEEPKDEDLRQLLSPPDLEDFDVPERLSNTSVTSVKKKKSKSGLKGKKKKKKGGKKKKTPTKETSTSPVESLFSYDPNAPDPIDMARQKVANRRRDNSELNSVMTTMKTFDDKMKNQPWLFGRMALSKQICRFWLPMDLRDLEGINPSQYLSQYCSVCKRRVKFYSQAFDRQLSRRKSKDTSPETKSTLDIKESEKAILDVHAGCINSEQLAYLCDLVCLSKKDGPQSVSRLNCKLFCSICALTERLFYSNFVTEDAIESDNSQRQRIEAADFDGLEWRLRNVKVTPELHRLLFLL